MRIGTPVFIAAFALLCTGLASTSRMFWENPYNEINTPLDMTNVHTLDLTETNTPNIKFSNVDASKFTYNESDRSETNRQKPQVSVSNGVMKIHFNPSGYTMPELILPTNLRVIKANSISFEEGTPVSSLTVEVENGMTWRGNAAELQIISRSTTTGYDRHVIVGSGEINQLKIIQPAGRIELTDSSKIQNAEILATQNTQLYLSNALDFQRFKIQKIESDISVESQPHRIVEPPRMKAPPQNSSAKKAN